MAMFLELKPEVVSGFEHMDDRDISKDRGEDNDNSNREGPCEGPQDEHDCCDEPPNREKGVGFRDCVSTREYKTVLGAHPDARDGPPIELGWSHVSRCTVIKDEHDSVHYIPKEERIKMLRASGYTDKDIQRAIKKVQRVQKGRVQSASIAARAASNRSMGYRTTSFGIPCRQTRPMVYVAATKNKNNQRSGDSSGKTSTTGTTTRSRGQSTFGFSNISKFKQQRKNNHDRNDDEESG